MEKKSEEFSWLQSDITVREVSYPNDLFGQAVDLKTSAKNLLMLKWKCTVENYFGRLKTEMFYGHEYEFHDYDTFKTALKKRILWWNNKRIPAKLNWLAPHEVLTNWNANVVRLF